LAAAQAAIGPGEREASLSDTELIARSAEIRYLIISTILFMNNYDFHGEPVLSRSGIGFMIAIKGTRRWGWGNMYYNSK